MLKERGSGVDSTTTTQAPMEDSERKDPGMNNKDQILTKGNLKTGRGWTGMNKNRGPNLKRGKMSTDLMSRVTGIGRERRPRRQGAKEK